MIRLKKDTDNIVTLVLDMSKRPDNIINHELTQSFLPVIQHLQEEKERGELRGVILTSAKKSFLSGGDLGYLYDLDDPQALFEEAEKLTKFYRDLERPGVPVIAAISGKALGAGFEVALACHYRIAIDNPKIRVGLPEVNLGFMPSGGSIMRMMWLLGIEKAYPVLTSGQHYSPQEALKAGIIDELAANEKEMMEKAKAWLLSHSDRVSRPWDRPGHEIPVGTVKNADLAERLRNVAAALSASTHNNSPAKHAILNAMAEGSKVDFDTACRIENRHFAELICSKTAKNMISAFWFDYHAIKSGVNRPKGIGKFRPRKIGIIGAGMMGSGIAFACIKNGLSVVLKDVSLAVAETGRQYVQEKLDELIETGTFQPSERDEILNRLIISENAENFKDCDLIVEAVFESKMVKQKVAKEAEAVVDEETVFGSNSISIPISKLAQGMIRPENYVGLHFFPPADEVPLVEIVRGDQTSDETIARAFDFVLSIMKIPIIVKDDWGFYAARVQNTYILEGIALLQEGYSPALIDNLGRQIGMPRGPLELADEIGLKLILKYEKQAAAHYGTKYVQHPSVTLLEQMVETFDRLGKTNTRGFYDYDKNGQKLQRWPKLTDHYPNIKTTYDRKKITERMLFAQVIEAVWCMQEKVVSYTAEANLGSIHGWNFPANTGGVIRFVHDYGVERFLEQCKVYRKNYGQRFRPPKILVKILQEPSVKPEKAAVE